MKNRWLDALWKTAIFLIAAHIVFLILGFVFRKDVGWFNLPMVWAHWTRGAGSSTTSILSLVGIYLITYFFFTKSHEELPQ